jgi:lysozyme
MKTSLHGIYAIAVHEGIVPGPYKDSVGVWTYGIGHTAAAGLPNPAMLPRGMPEDIDKEIKTVVELFQRDLVKYETGVNRAVKVPVKQHEFDALVSFHYNTGKVGSAKLTTELNAGNRVAAAAAFMNWLKPKELEKRRIAERRLFAEGIYPEEKVNVWKVSNTGRVIWQVVKQFDMEEFFNIFTSQSRLHISDLPLCKTKDDIRRLQRMLGVNPDGDIGEETYTALLTKVDL